MIMPPKTEEELQKALKNIHVGHRQRMREKFLRTGTLENFADHEILEMLLFPALPRRNTNPIAHHLLLKFGSLDKVLEASVEELQTVPGIGPKAAQRLTEIPALAHELEEVSHLTPDPIPLRKPRALERFMEERFPARAPGTLYLLLLDPDYNFLAALPFYSLNRRYLFRSLRQFNLKRAARIYCVESVPSAEEDLPLSASVAFPIISPVLDAYLFSSWDYFLSNQDGLLIHIHNSATPNPCRPPMPDFRSRRR